jgi:hypothetical protein
MSDEMIHVGKSGGLREIHAFAHPADILNDPQLRVSEKREMLAWWASDARGVESAPGLRRGPSGAVVSLDDIMTALKSLDWTAEETTAAADTRFEACRSPMPAVDDHRTTRIQ